MTNQPPEAREGDTDRSQRMWQLLLSSAPSSSGTSGEPSTSPSWAAAGAPHSQFYDPCHTCAVTWSFSYEALRARKFCWISLSNCHSPSGQGAACQLCCSNMQTEHRHLHRGPFMLQNVLHSVHLLISGTQETMTGLVQQLAWHRATSKSILPMNYSKAKKEKKATKIFFLIFKF